MEIQKNLELPQQSWEIRLELVIWSNVFLFHRFEIQLSRDIFAYEVNSLANVAADNGQNSGAYSKG